MPGNSGHIGIQVIQQHAISCFLYPTLANHVRPGGCFIFNGIVSGYRFLHILKIMVYAFSDSNLAMNRRSGFVASERFIFEDTGIRIMGSSRNSYTFLSVFF